MILELMKYFSACPLLNAEKADVDLLGQAGGSFTIEAVPCEPVIKRYYTGGALKQYCFVLALRQAYGFSPADNMENEQVLEGITDWVETNNQKAVLPELGAGLTAQDLSVISAGYMFDENSNHARYQIGLRLTYTDLRRI